MITKKIFILIVFALLAISVTPAMATINVTAGQITSSSITWTWTDGLNITYMAIDGYHVTQYNPTGGSFILTGLNPGEWHNIVITTDVDSGNNTAQTLSQALALNTGTSTDIYLWALAGILGLALFLLSLRPSHSSDEIIINTIISVIAWLPIGFCAYSSFNVSQITSTGYVILYSYGTIGILMYVFLAVVILNTVRLIALHRVFSGSDNE
jgi:hypothetical protein